MTDQYTREQAMEAIEAERQRQIDEEGWTSEHDDTHSDREMLRAAIIYTWHGTDHEAPLRPNDAPLGWPWETQWWKPKDRYNNLIRAGALCLAEKDRLRRRNPKRPNYGHVDQKLRIILREIESLRKDVKP